MKKVTIIKENGTGILTLADDGKWDISMNGEVAPGNLHYTTDQVEKIIVASKAAGHKVVVNE